MMSGVPAWHLSRAGRASRNNSAAPGRCAFPEGKASSVLRGPSLTFSSLSSSAPLESAISPNPTGCNEAALDTRNRLRIQGVPYIISINIIVGSQVEEAKMAWAIQVFLKGRVCPKIKIKKKNPVVYSASCPNLKTGKS